MSTRRLTTWTVATALLLFSQGTNVLAGPIGLVDDFSGDLSAWTSTRILDSNGGAHDVTSFQINGSGKLEMNTTTFDAGSAEQYALTRTDFTLGVGEELRGDFAAGYTGTQDIGLYVGAGTPTLDVRANYVNIYVRNNGQIFSRGFNGSSEFALAGGATPSISTLFVRRTGVDTFDLGYYDNSFVKNVLTSRTIGSGNAAGIGGSIGAYTDIRSAGIIGNLDNLRIVPEPATWLLGMLSLIGIAPLCRRSRS